MSQTEGRTAMTTETICPVCDAPLGAHDETGHPTTTKGHEDCYVADAETQFRKGLITAEESATARPVVIHRGCQTVRQVITESEARVLDGNR
jgi:hypothetical protein